MKFLATAKRLLSAGALIALACAAAAQQTYPTRPMRFILPNAPGGSNSFVARLLGEKLTASWGQQVIVDSRPGGNNVIARIQAMPDFKEKLASQDVEPFISGPEQFGAFIKAEMAKYARIIKLANIRIEH